MNFGAAALLPSLLFSIALLAWLSNRVQYPSLLNTFHKLGNIGTTDEELKTLDKRLKALSSPLTAETFTAGRLVLTLVFMMTGGVLVLNNPARGFELLVLSVLAWRTPYRLLAALEKKRKEELRRDFALMVNQVRIFAKASDLYQALKIVPYAVKGKMGKELRLLSADLEMSSLSEALDNFAKRCGLKEAEDFSQIIQVGVRTGADVGLILGNYAKSTQKRRIGEIKRWIKIQPIIFSVLPAMLLTLFVLMWIVPMYMNIIDRLRSI